MFRFMWTVVFAVSVVYEAVAHEKKFTKIFETCMEASQGITAEMRECISSEYSRQDDRLNRAYQNLLAQHDTSWRERIRDAQRKWLAYRDAACPLHAPPNSGTLEHLMVGSCYLEMTEQQAVELERLAAR